MKRALALVLMSFLGLIGAVLPLEVAAEEKTPCVFYWGESRYSVGYDHLVHVVNTCTVEATCTLSTNVNPTPEVFPVAPGEHKVITTWRGSPWYVFTIYMSCVLVPA